MKLKWSARAERDLEDIGDYIGRDDPGAARRYVQRLILRVRQLRRTPRSGRIVPELGNPLIRELIFQNYRIVYALREKRVMILTVSEGHRTLAIAPEEVGEG